MTGYTFTIYAESLTEEEAEYLEVQLEGIVEIVAETLESRIEYLGYVQDDGDIETVVNEVVDDYHDALQHMEAHDEQIE